MSIARIYLLACFVQVNVHTPFSQHHDPGTHTVAMATEVVDLSDIVMRWAKKMYDVTKKNRFSSISHDWMRVR